MKFPAFVGGSYVSQSPAALAARTVNWYVENIEVPGGRSEQVLYPTPGVQAFASESERGTPIGAVGRAAFSQAGRCWFVIGQYFLEVYADGSTVLRGTVKTDQFPATISSNGANEPGVLPADSSELFITSGNRGYIFNLETNLLNEVVSIRDGCRQGAMLDSYFLRLDAAAFALYLSELNDGLTWDATQVARRSIASDPWVAMAVNYREVWLFGTETSEVWYDAGTSPFPFAAHPSGIVPYGIAAIFSVKNVNGTLMWLGRTRSGSGQVLSAQGFNPKVISTHAFQVAIEKYPTIADAIGDTFDVFGHTFYLLTFPTANTSWLYDLTTGTWTEIATWLEETAEYTAWRSLFHAFAFDKHLIADRGSGTISELSPEFGSDVEGRVIRRLRQCPVPMKELERVFIRDFTLFMETGLAFQTAQPSLTSVESAEQYRLSVINAGAEAFWWCDEQEGPVLVDSSAHDRPSSPDQIVPDGGHGRHPATIIGPGAVTFCVPGAIGGGTVGIGFSDPLGVSATCDLFEFITAEGGTVEFWLSPTVTSVAPSLLIGSVPGGGVSLGGSVPRLSATGTPSGGPISLPLSIGQLYHCVLRIDPSMTAQFYLNGEPSGTAALMGSFAIDRLFGPGSFTAETALRASVVDAIAVYPYAVSPSTIREHFDLGVGHGQQGDPIVTLRKSMDGAKTWGNERSRSAGKVGRYRTRVNWMNCGSARDPYFEVTVSHPIPWRLVDAFLDIKGGRS